MIAQRRQLFDVVAICFLNYFAYQIEGFSGHTTKRFLSTTSPNRRHNGWITRHTASLRQPPYQVLYQQKQCTVRLQARRIRAKAVTEDDDDDDNKNMPSPNDDIMEMTGMMEDDDDFLVESVPDDNEEEDDDDVERDVPDDWSEDDILAAVGDVVARTDDDDNVVVDGDIEVANKMGRKINTKGGDTTEIEGITITDIDDDDIILEDDEFDIDDVDLDDVELTLDEEEEEEDDDDDLIFQSVSKVESDGKLPDYAKDDGDWDEDDDGGTYELYDDPLDPDLAKQKELISQAIIASQQRAQDEEFDALDFVQNELTEQDADAFDQLPFMKEVAEQMKQFDMFTEQDFDGKDLDEEVEKVSDIMDDDPYPRHGPGELNFLQENVGLTDDDMEALDTTYKEVGNVINEEPWDKVFLKDMTGWDDLSNQTIEEMEAALEEIGGSAYNVSRWLLYDLDFNVSNLILAAVKHNKEAPILFQHWYPQLVTYERYQHARDRDFDFTWHDVEQADIGELERYYAGFGYDEIPQKAPGETGIISFEDLDEEEIKMAAFENWVTRVYNPEMDRTDFDDDGMRDEDNVFSEFYEPPQHPDLPSLEDAEDDIDEWNAEMGDDEEIREYRDMMGQKFEYEVVEDEEFTREFRGHLIIACTGRSEDLDIAEKITKIFEKEFGKKVYVETRIMSLAREEDNVFEVWLESYEIDLLHSKKRATSNTVDWKGPAECDDEQIEYLVDRVGFLISDDARYSYRMEVDYAV